MMINKEFASGKFQVPQGKQALTKEWKNLTEQLNELGPLKTVEQWKRVCWVLYDLIHICIVKLVWSCVSYPNVFQVWKNQKMQTRKRSSEIKMAHLRTGNMTPPPPLSDREKNILGIIGTESSQGLGLGEGSLLYHESEPSTSFHSVSFYTDTVIVFCNNRDIIIIRKHMCQKYHKKKLRKCSFSRIMIMN